MKTYLGILGVIALTLFLGQLPAHASLINLNPSNTAPTSNGDNQVATWLGGLVATYNAGPTANLPLPITPITRVNSGDTTVPLGYTKFGSDVKSISIILGGFDYLVLHWGNDRALQAFYVGDLTGPETFFSPNNRGLSFYATYNVRTPPTAVPEPGTVVSGLLLLGGTAFSVMRRKRAN